MIPVASSNVQSVGYDTSTNTLRIAFHSGGLYDYRNVPEHVYRSLMTASSVGSYFANHVKPYYTPIKLR